MRCSSCALMRPLTRSRLPERIRSGADGDAGEASGPLGDRGDFRRRLARDRAPDAGANHVWRPAWVALVLVYWCMAAPDQVGVVAGWTTGLLLDVMTGTLLGQHALGLSVVGLRHASRPQARAGAAAVAAGDDRLRARLSLSSISALEQRYSWHTGRSVCVLGVSVRQYALVALMFRVLRAVRRRYDVVRPA